MPKAFITHATEDKSRFVIAFATSLRKAGIDAWVDEWEIKPGDSLVRKIFAEGLNQSDVVVVVLSKKSVKKPWVLEELDISVINRIQRDAKIIPVILDHLTDQEIPQALRATRYVKIKDTDSYGGELDSIINAIHGFNDKPALGTPPNYVAAKISALPGLTKIDTLVLNNIYQEAMKVTNLSTYIAVNVNGLPSQGISFEALQESLHILEDHRLLQASRSFGPDITHVMPTIHGFGVYGGAYIDRFEEIIDGIVAYIVNHVGCSDEDVATDTGQAAVMINYVLRMLDERKLAVVSFTIGGRARILTVKPSLTRKFQC